MEGFEPPTSGFGDQRSNQTELHLQVSPVICECEPYFTFNEMSMSFCVFRGQSLTIFKIVELLAAILTLRDYMYYCN